MTSNSIGGVPSLTVTEVSNAISQALGKIYPRKVWIEGEIAELKPKPHPTGHYFSLVEGEGEDRRALAMRLFTRGNKLAFVEKKMSTIGYPLQNGMRVRFLCRLNFYLQKGELSVIIDDVDPNFTLGTIAQKREQVIARITAGGFDKLNKRIRVPSVPLRFGVVSSNQADGWQDALKQFQESGYSFQIVFCQSSVQGLAAPAELVAAIRTLDQRHDIDLILVMRGGGSKSDLAAFDDEEVAMSIARCRHPVFTGIGHAPDHTIADLVSHSSFKTPTATAEAVIAKIRRFMDHLNTRGNHLVRSSRSVANDARRRLDGKSHRLVGASRGKIDRAREKNLRASATLAKRPEQVIETHRLKLNGFSSTVRLLDPSNTLARGWTLTRNAQGKIIRSSSDVTNGQLLVTSFVDGNVVSAVKEETSDD